MARASAVSFIQRAPTLPRMLAPMDGLALLWLLLGLLSAWHVWYWPDYSAGVWSLVLAPLLLYLAVRVLAGDPRHGRLVVTSLGIGGALAATIGLLSWLGGDGVIVDGTRRLLGLTFSPNQTALILLRSLFVCAGMAVFSAHRMKAGAKVDSLRGSAAWWIATVVVAIALVLTGSRGALLLGVPVGLAVFFFLYRARPLHRRWLITFTLVIGLAAVVVLLGWGDRLTNSETVLRRFAIWQGSLELWRAHPALGVGPGGFFWTYPAFITPAAVDEPNLLHAHNLWLNLLTGWGLLGLLWLMAWLLWLNGRMRQFSQKEAAWWQMGLIAALAAALAHGQVDAFLVLPELAAWNWIVFALLAGCPQKKCSHDSG